MTHVSFDPNSINWSAIVAANTGQEGFGKFFEGTRYQRGFGNLNGFGTGLFQNVLRFLQPIAKNFVHSFGSEGVAAGARVLGDIGDGRDFKESLMEHSKQGMANLASKIQQCGKGKRGRPKAYIKKKQGLNFADPYIRGGETPLQIAPSIGNSDIVKKSRKRKPDLFDI